MASLLFFCFFSLFLFADYIDDLMKKMTIEEKIGQLNLLDASDFLTATPSNTQVATEIRRGRVGAILNIAGVVKINQTQHLAVEESRLGIPLFYGLDVIHGYRTAFPIPLGLAHSWDLDLIQNASEIAASEATADGICWAFSPMVDIARDPRWGRVAEGAGEDPYLGSRIAEAMVKGYEGTEKPLTNRNMLSCVKHFASYGAVEAGRDYNTVDMSKYRMYNEYLPPYKAAVEAGASTIMASYNDLNGLPSHANKWLLDDILRKKMKFEGLIASDYNGVIELVKHGLGDIKTVAGLSLEAGMEMDMCGEAFSRYLRILLAEEEVHSQRYGTEKVLAEKLDTACRHVLQMKERLGLFEDPYRYTYRSDEIFPEEHRKIARSVAADTFVLLKNKKKVLPLNISEFKEGETKKKIALVGPLYDQPIQMTGTWSGPADARRSVSLRDGLVDALGGEEAAAGVLFTARAANVVDSDDMDHRVNEFGKDMYRDPRPADVILAEALAVAQNCDVIIAAFGESAEMSGESSSRVDLTLPRGQHDALAALVATGKPVVLVLFSGRPLVLTPEEPFLDTILAVWYPGTEAGHAICDVLFGDVNPSGHLTMSWPYAVGQIPVYYAHMNTGRPKPLNDDFGFVKYISEYLDCPNLPLFPFGYGLSYTSFRLDNLALSKTILDYSRNTPEDKDSIVVTVDVTNSGDRAGKTVVQMYIRDVVGTRTRPVKELKGFQKVSLEAGETKTVSFTITQDDLAYYPTEDYTPVAERGEFRVMLGLSSDTSLAETFYLY